MKQRRTWWITGRDVSAFASEWNARASRNAHRMDDMGIVAIRAGHPDCEAFARLLKDRLGAHDLQIRAANYQAFYAEQDVLKCELVQVDSDDFVDLCWQEFATMFHVARSCAVCDRGVLSQTHPIRLPNHRIRGDLLTVRVNNDWFVARLASSRLKDLLERFPDVSFQPVLTHRGEVSPDYHQLTIGARMPHIVPPTTLHQEGPCSQCGGMTHFHWGDTDDTRTVELCFPRPATLPPIALTGERRGRQSHLNDAMSAILVSAPVYREIWKAELRIGGAPAHLLPPRDSHEAAHLDQITADLRKRHENGAPTP